MAKTSASKSLTLTLGSEFNLPEKTCLLNHPRLVVPVRILSTKKHQELEEGFGIRNSKYGLHIGMFDHNKKAHYLRVCTGSEAHLTNLADQIKKAQERVYGTAAAIFITPVKLTATRDKTVPEHFYPVAKRLLNLEPVQWIYFQAHRMEHVPFTVHVNDELQAEYDVDRRLTMRFQKGQEFDYSGDPIVFSLLQRVFIGETLNERLSNDLQKAISAKP